MTQLSPSNIEYAQVLALISKFSTDYLAGNYNTPEEVSEQINSIFAQYNNIAGHSLTQYECVYLGEPANSAKMSRIFSAIESDINILQEQNNILRSAIIFLHNYTASEIELAKNQNAQASNKLKTLQLYANVNDSNVIQYGDHFSNLDFVDTLATNADQQASLLSRGVLGLGRDSKVIILNDESNLKVLDTSNGFLGNNQEINDPAQAVVIPNTAEHLYVFKAQTETRHSDLRNILDGEPNTWTEYEYNFINPQDKIKTKNFNFTYQRKDFTNNQSNSITNDGVTADLSNASNANATTPGLIDWSIGPPDKVLKLDLEFNLKSAKVINTITYNPFGLANNKNTPTKVRLVQTSENGTDWTPVFPQNVFIATDANLPNSRSSDNLTIGSAIWTFDERSVQYIRMAIEQLEPVDANVGHVYYETVLNNTNTGDREEGPIPSIDDPTSYYKDNGTTKNRTGQNAQYFQGNRYKVAQKTEYFPGKRWAIGIRDITIQETKYKPTSFIVSKPFRINGVVDRVSLEADMFVPSNFPSTDSWIKFYVSPNDGLNWYPISRIQDDYLGYPEIIAFNDPIPASFREVGVSYITTNSIVNSIRIKIEFNRPADLASSTPILKSYTLKIRRR